MDAADIFRSVLPRQSLPQLNPHPHHPHYARVGPPPHQNEQQQQQHHLHPQQHPQQYVPIVHRRPLQNRLGFHGHAADNRIAHTLTACCRCRQRKTRCDPSLPRCLPCERSGSVCEYYDTTKNGKISRNYVVQLQERVRVLTAELSQYTDDDDDEPDLYDGFLRGSSSGEGLLRPGEMVRLNDSCDETPRYLGPSSGIAMTRLLMEAAKRYTDSASIAELFPGVKGRRARVQSVVMGGTAVPPERRRSFPMISEVPADSLPTKQIANRLIEIFNQRAQLFWPTFHEQLLAKDFDAVYDGDADPYRNFVVRMVIAVSLQKLDPQYAGLADSYYLASMRYFEDVVRPKDLKTLQCLLLVGQYSLLTPTRTAVYFVIGLATRICQQLGFADEKTIANGDDCDAAVDALTLDLRRRVFWAIAAMEMGLAHTMGRPSGFAKGDDAIDVELFSTTADENITEDGVLSQAPACEKKLFAIHFYKMRQRQADIRRILYEKKRPEPRDESHPWYATMEQSIQKWLDDSPAQPAWCRPWFVGRFHQLRIFLYRPSPQVPNPTPAAAAICFESAAHIILLSKQQVERAAVDITWVFLLVLYMALNTLLWTVSSYHATRAAHPRKEVEDLVNIAIDILEQCAERWPGTSAAAQLYNIFARACLQSYDSNENMLSNPWNTPPSAFDANIPIKTEHSLSPPSLNGRQHHPQQPPQGLFGHNGGVGVGVGGGQFGNYMFDVQRNPGSAMGATAFSFDPATFARQTARESGPLPQPTFRSNSIFFNPATDAAGRRFSYFPPEFPTILDGEPLPEDATPSPSAHSATTVTAATAIGQHAPDSVSPLPVPTSPEQQLAFGGGAAQQQQQQTSVLMPPGPDMTPRMAPAPSPNGLPTTPASIMTPSVAATSPVRPPQQPHQDARASSRTPTFSIPHPRTNHNTPAPPQRPLPQAPFTGDWFSPPPPFISSFPFGPLSSQLLSDGATATTISGGQLLPSRLQPGGFDLQDGFALLGILPGVLAEFDFGVGQGRQGSLNSQQLMELGGMLEDNGQSEIDTLLSMGLGMGGETAGMGPGAAW